MDITPLFNLSWSWKMVDIHTTAVPISNAVSLVAWGWGGPQKEECAEARGQRRRSINQAKKGGVCRSHGAEVKVYRCSNEGCTNRAKKEECASGMGKCRSQTMQQGRMHESSHLYFPTYSPFSWPSVYSFPWFPSAEEDVAGSFVVMFVWFCVWMVLMSVI